MGGIRKALSTLNVLGLSLLFLVMTWPGVVAAAEQGGRGEPADESEADEPTAPVEIDGRFLFLVRGVLSFPAGQRAAAIAARIVRVARDPAIRPEAVRHVEADGVTDIMVGDKRLMRVLDVDAQLERVPRRQLADGYVERIRDGIESYRAARTAQALLLGATIAVIATLAAAAALKGVGWLSRRLVTTLEERFRTRIGSVGIQSFEIVRAERVWDALRGAIRVTRTLVVLMLVFIYLQIVLGQFPWTRPIASRLLDLVVDPLKTMGEAVLARIPDLLFVAVLIVVTRYALRLLRPFFDAVERGRVTLAGFEPEWAGATYKIVRLAIVAFAFVVAYPYIPGSSSEAFKGVSLFLGVVFSLGSSTAVSNMIAGYMLIYRRAFRIGDRVKIGNHIGDVAERRLQVTHLRTPKNEEVIIPNATIISSEVVNYSTLARQGRLILHTTVGIGYETPWRQVEAMLLLAADRTPGLLKDPAPFVLQASLGDFAVNYEINVHVDNAQAMERLYAELHRSILDVFNEYGVQIMTPAYERDPDQAKVVPKAQWFIAPAKPPDHPPVSSS